MAKTNKPKRPITEPTPQRLEKEAAKNRLQTTQHVHDQGGSAGGSGSGAGNQGQSQGQTQKDDK